MGSLVLLQLIANRPTFAKIFFRFARRKSLTRPISKTRAVPFSPLLCRSRIGTANEKFQEHAASFREATVSRLSRRLWAEIAPLSGGFPPISVVIALEKIEMRRARPPAPHFPNYGFDPPMR